MREAASTEQGVESAARRTLGHLMVGASLEGEAVELVEGSAEWPAGPEPLAGERGDVDLVAAAGLGDVARIEALVATDGSLREGAHALVHYSLEPWPQDAGDAEVLAVALCVAARCGRVAALRRLVELGADVDAHPPFDHGATALHWCVIGDQPEALTALLELGADREACDRTYGTTPRRWSEVLGRARLTPVLG